MGAPDSDDYFPDDDFFPDVDNLLDEMAGEDTDPKIGASAPVPYVLILLMLEALPPVPALVSILDVFRSSSYMQMLFTFSLSVCMTYFIYAILVMRCLVFPLIKLFGKLLIFPTIQKPYYRQFTPSGFDASMRPPMFEGINYKRWRVRVVLWFQTMSCYDATLGKPEGEYDAQQAQAF